MDLALEGRVAVVAGGSKGLGRAVAIALGQEGVRLLLAARDEEALNRTAEEVRASGTDASYAQVDVATPESAQQLIDLATDTFGRLDIVIANSGGPPPGSTLSLDSAAISSAVNDHMLFAVRLANASLPRLRSQGWGRICCIGSHSVQQVIPRLPLSNISRAALWAWVKTAAQEVADSGVTINLLCPGAHATDRIKELGIAGRVGEPGDFGQVVTFLCSEQAKYLNGAAIVVDGGTNLAL